MLACPPSTNALAAKPPLRACCKPRETPRTALFHLGLFQDEEAAMVSACRAERASERPEADCGGHLSVFFRCAPTAQGIDLKAGGRSKKVHRTAPKSDNVYLKLLVKVCRACSVV
jgi:hypothetical protein